MEVQNKEGEGHACVRSCMESVKGGARVRGAGIGGFEKGIFVEEMLGKGEVAG
jgi:hypothetical protein